MDKIRACNRWGALLILIMATVFYLSTLASAAVEPKIILVRDGEPLFVIVTPDLPSQTVNESVAELNYWIQRITGAALPVIPFAQWDGVSPYISVGPTALADLNGWNLGEFAQEEARVFIEEHRIGLLGNDDTPYLGVSWRGTYYAVLEFIQKSLGARSIWPGASGDVFTPRDTLEIHASSWTWVPTITLSRVIRNGYDSKSIANDAQEYFKYVSSKPEAFKAMAQLEREQDQWLRRHRMNVSSNLRFGHSYTDWWERYGEEHPDWFAKPPQGVTQLGGAGVKLNLSNPEVQDKVFSTWETAWLANPGANKAFPVGPNDSRGFDTRPETRAWDAPELQRFSDKEIYNGSEPILSDRYLRFWNIIARRIAEVDPEVLVTTYAYRNYRTPPLGDEMVEPNIVIGYVGGEGYYPDENYIRDEWQGWSERGAKLVWRPNLLNCGHGTPYLFSKALYDDFHFLQEHGLLGTDFDSLTGNWAGQGLVYYVLAAQHTRPEATYDELADEYFSAFGPAADAIRQYTEYLEHRTRFIPEIIRQQGLSPRETWGGWWIAHIRVIPLYFTPEVTERSNELLLQAETAVANSDAIFQERVELIRNGFEHARLMAEAFRRLQLDDPQATASYDDAKEVLQPLWDFRLAHSTNPLMPVVKCLVEEERRLGIWSAFRTSKRAGPPLGSGRVTLRALDKGWQFRADPSNKGLDQGWQKFKDTETGWVPIQVGKPWRKALPDVEETRIGWYRLDLEVPEHAGANDRLFLVFASVDAEVSLWVNGELVYERGYPHDANYDSWIESFWVDMSGLLKAGEHNLLVLRVESEVENAGITGGVSFLMQ